MLFRSAAGTLTVPPSTIARFRASTANGGAGGQAFGVFSEIVEGNVTPSGTTGIASLGWDVSSSEDAAAGHFELRVSSTSTIEYDWSIDAGGSTFDVSTYGWIDHRGRLS